MKSIKAEADSWLSRRFWYKNSWNRTKTNELKMDHQMFTEKLKLLIPCSRRKPTNIRLLLTFSWFDWRPLNRGSSRSTGLHHNLIQNSCWLDPVQSSTILEDPANYSRTKQLLCLCLFFSLNIISYFIQLIKIKSAVIFE